MLQFIDQTPGGIRSSDRRTIRSHVMRGKNAGKKRPAIRQKLEDVRMKQKANHSTKPPYSIPRQVLWSDLSLTRLPEQLDSKSTGLLHRWFFDISDALFPPQFCNKFDIIKSIWVNCILVDEAYFHSTLAISASYVNFVRRKPYISTNTLHHISQAYALVNNKLSGPNSVSDSAIAAVVSLVIYQQIHHQVATGLVHLGGLYKMIQLRGGIGKLMQENRALALKPLRLDIELAMRSGTPPVLLDETLPVRSILCDFDTDDLPHLELPLMPPMMLDIFKFSVLLNQAHSNTIPKLNPLDFTETIVALLYRLIGGVFAMPVMSDKKSNFHDLLHPTMIAFMSTLLPEYTLDKSGRCTLSSRLEDRLQETYFGSILISDLEASILVWILFISAISVLDAKNNEWLLPLLAGTIDRLQLTSWSQAEQQLKMFPWIDCIHGPPARDLWDHLRGLELIFVL
ncbi:hypothetical protein N7456_000982 [Penicillium angulare]|uniref:Uncharacterized protein n=1 Tax=Penicillium angulare TaxID=116970 RepID=A0A9W9GD62_9EURO|nr:hypothetical protein N7456_000982 [Penicillium angulare]